MKFKLCDYRACHYSLWKNTNLGKQIYWLVGGVYFFHECVIRSKRFRLRNLFFCFWNILFNKGTEAPFLLFLGGVSLDFLQIRSFCFRTSKASLTIWFLTLTRVFGALIWLFSLNLLATYCPVSREIINMFDGRMFRMKTFGPKSNPVGTPKTAYYSCNWVAKLYQNYN